MFCWIATSGAIPPFPAPMGQVLNYPFGETNQSRCPRTTPPLQQGICEVISVVLCLALEEIESVLYIKAGSRAL